MKVILREDKDDLGFAGDIVDVAKGYGRNYLIPKGVALEANNQNIKLMETQKKKIEIKRLKAKEDAEKISKKLEGIVVTISQKAGEEDKLYGSVTSMDIASHLEGQGVVIDRKKITLDKPIKTLGEFDVPIKLYPGVTGGIKVMVVPEKS
ncbi:MAG: 50S ribosomal protein L9 [Deltaproteobacteria bacterium]|nr:50S ribosomal protein L9 [Deltaproteobacteria bacterium]